MSVKSVVQRGLGDDARPGDGHPPLPRIGEFKAAVAQIAELDSRSSRGRASSGSSKKNSQVRKPCHSRLSRGTATPCRWIRVIRSSA